MNLNKDNKESNTQKDNKASKVFDEIMAALIILILITFFVNFISFLVYEPFLTAERGFRLIIGIMVFWFLMS